MPSIFTYEAPGATGLPTRTLVSEGGPAAGERFAFYDRLEIGRRQPGGTPAPGTLWVEDPTVSSRHCILTQTAEGRCFVRDVSRNGTRVEGRRLVPNLEVEMSLGEAITLGAGHVLRLEGTPAADLPFDEAPLPGTMVAPTTAQVTIVVGDIRNYTVLVRRAEGNAVPESISRVFAALEKVVAAHGGAIKEYQGDALFAYWEESGEEPAAAAACRGALALDAEARRLAGDPAAWSVPGFPLEMDWALATGAVVINTFGGDHPTGLSMIGAPVVRAFRIEKFADDATGSIVACAATVERAGSGFAFRDLGERLAKGFDRAERIYALTGEEARA